MTSIPASRSARAMIFAPRSWPSRPGLATTTRIFLVDVLFTAARKLIPYGPGMGVLACSLAALLLAGSGGSSRHLETALQDDALLLDRPAYVVRQTARTIAALGVDRVRLTANWSQIAPEPRSRARPVFDATDPSAYPRGAWDRLDTAVRAVRDAGMQVMIDIGFWAPRWAVRKPSANRDR